MEKIFIVNGTEYKAQDFKKTADSISFVLNGKEIFFNMISRSGPEMVLEGNQRFKAAVGSLNRDGESMVIANGHEAMIATGTKKPKRGTGHGGGLISPMPGKIFKVLKETGAEVQKGETILILEAMKMEHSIRSDKDGRVKKIHFKVGELVQGGVTLAEVE